MTVDPNLINRLLSRLTDFLSRLERMEFTLQELQQEKDIQDLIAFRLQEAIEISINIAMHIVSAEKLGSPETNKSVFPVLTSAKIINQKLAQKMAQGVGFRNIVVHRYDEIDLKRLFHDYHHDIKTLYQFAQAIQKFIDQK